MKAGVYRFKTIEEENKWVTIERIKEGKTVEDIDRYEYIRLQVKAYPPGIYRFKSVKEKQQDEIRRVIEAWDKKG